MEAGGECAAPVRLSMKHITLASADMLDEREDGAKTGTGETARVASSREAAEVIGDLKHHPEILR